MATQTTQQIIGIRTWNKWRKQAKLIQRCQLGACSIFPCIIQHNGKYIAGDINYSAGREAVVSIWEPKEREFISGTNPTLKEGTNA